MKITNSIIINGKKYVRVPKDQTLKSGDLFLPKNTKPRFLKNNSDAVLWDLTPQDYPDFVFYQEVKE